MSDRVATYILDSPERALVDFSIARILHTREHDQFWRDTCLELSTEEDQPWIHAFRPIAGFESHREEATHWIGRQGLRVERDDILITNGAAHGIFLALASLAGPDDVVLCEGITDHGVIGNSQVLGFTLKGLEMDRYGIDPEHFEDMCSNERITALVCTPNLNNPTTSLMPDSVGGRLPISPGVSVCTSLKTMYTGRCWMSIARRQSAITCRSYRSIALA